MRITLGLVLIFCFATLEVQASFTFPTNLSAKDRDRITEILGYGNSTKLTGNPYPLGGYSGVELGYSVEQVNTEDISRLGNSSATTQKDLTYPRLSFGKGLYNNFDLFVHFIPYSETIGYSEYGGMLRYCFFQAAFIPTSFSLMFHANSSNVGNVFFSQTRGVELLSGLNVGNLSLYIGAGQVWAEAVFSKNINAPDNGQVKDQRSSINGFHTFAGGAFELEPYFFAVQADQYTQTAFSGKVGVRF